MSVHYGLSSPGHVALCGSADGTRWTAVRMVDCQYCQNVVDSIVHASKQPALTLPPARTKPTQQRRKGGG